MSLTPSGKQQVMKGQQVRPVHRVDLSPLLKIVEAQNAARVKTAQMFQFADEVPNKTKPTSGDAAAAPQSQPQQPQQQQKPQARPTIQQDKVDMGGPESGVAQPENVPDGQGAPSDQQGATPPQQVPQPSAGEVPQAPDQQKSPEQEQMEILKLRDGVRGALGEMGLAFDLDTSGDSIIANVQIAPHVKADSDGQYYPADQVMRPAMEKMFHLATQFGKKLRMKEPTPAQAHRRRIDPNAKPLTYSFTFTNAGGDGAADGQQTHMYTIPQAPKGGKPVRGDVGTGRPNSRMGNPPQQPDAEAMGDGFDTNGMGTPTMPEIMASKKDDIIAALKTLLGGSK